MQPSKNQKPTSQSVKKPTPVKYGVTVIKK